MKFFIVTLVLLSSCGNEKDPQIIAVHQRSADDMLQYRDRFVDYLVVAGLSTDLSTVEFVRNNLLSASIAGSCHKVFDEETWEVRSRVVSVNPYYWDRYNRARRESLIFHELGHCVLDRSHRSDLDSSGSPVSVMHPNLLLASTYVANYASLVSELLSVPEETFVGLTFDASIFSLTTELDTSPSDGSCGTDNNLLHRGPGNESEDQVLDREP